MLTLLAAARCVMWVAEGNPPVRPQPLARIARVIAPIPFTDLRPVYDRHRDQIDAAVGRVLRSGRFILGPEVERFEADLAGYVGRGHAVAVASGTDAIELLLRGHGLGPGDEVITVAHTAVATVAGIEAAGARPVLVDVDPLTMTMDPAAAAAAVGPRTAAVLPVHLYGHPAAMGPLSELAARHRLLLMEDCAQALGARLDGAHAGALAGGAALSFYPTKTLGAFGDAGAVVTDDERVAERVRRLRSYGQADRYRHLERGVNSRMDELQAAILGCLLPHLDAANAERRTLAARYRERLQGVQPPVEAPGAEHAYHLFVVRSAERDGLQRRLTGRGVETLIHYPVPVHLQPAYASLELRAGALPVTEKAAAEVLSLPLYPGLGVEAVDRVCEAAA